MKKQSSIQQKLMAVIMFTSGIVLFMTCLAFFVYEYITAQELAKRNLSTLAQIVASNSTAALAFDNKEDAAETLRALAAEKNIQAAALYDEKGKLFARYPSGVPLSTLPAQVGQDGYSVNGDFMEGYQAVTQNGTRLGTLFLRSDLRSMYHRFILYGIIAALFIIISFIFAWFISRLLQKSISNPIIQLTDIAKIVSDKQNYSVRAVNTSNDEVGTLTEAFNHMLTRIEIQNAEITSLNQNLEQKVKQRTRDLELANEELMMQTELNDTILDSSIDLIAVFDTELRYVTMNKHAQKVYNTTKEAIAGKYVADVFPQTVSSGMVDDLRAALKGEIVKHINYVSGVTRRHHQNFYIPLTDPNGKVYQVLAIAHDITDIMEANVKLQQVNAELEKSNHELEQFAYVASHDLQEPLRKIQTFAELAEKSKHDDETLHKYLTKVSSSANRMTELIKAVLNYSRVTTAESEFIDVDLNNILQSICIDLELLIQEKNAKITYDQLPVISGVPLQIHQLFINLITNSLKFTERTPEININWKIATGTQLNELTLAGDKEYLQLAFSDNGIGFEQKFADKVFSIFQRLHAEKRFEGTGIGLAVCKKIVENHNGSITVQSEPGKGTTFFVYLPAAAVAVTQLTNTSSTNTHAF